MLALHLQYVQGMAVNVTYHAQQRRQVMATVFTMMMGVTLTALLVDLLSSLVGTSLLELVLA